MKQRSVFSGDSSRKQKNMTSTYDRGFRIRGIRIVCIVLLLIALTVLQTFAEGSTVYDFSDETTTAAASNSGDCSLSPEQILEEMTLRQKVEQMIMPSVRDEKGDVYSLTELTPTAQKAIETHSFCGYLFYSENCESFEQVTRLTTSMQRAAVSKDASLQIPLLMMVDQEGGLIDRLAGTLTPGNLALGASEDAGLAEETAEIIGTEMMRAGFNTNAAPVLNLAGSQESGRNNLRFFGSSPEITAEMGAGFIRGLHSVGIASAVKSFPGSSDTDTDSHTGLPLVRKTISELEESDLIPFRRSIEEGTDLIMTSHVEYPLVEKDFQRSVSNGEKVSLPATLSDDILTGILREKMGYDDVIITDCLNAAPITEHFDPADAAQMAINAGADVLLSPGDITTEAHVKVLDEYVQAIVKRVKKGAIPESRIDEAVLHILKLKDNRGILDQAASWQTMSDVNVEKRVTEAEKYIADENNQKAVKVITERTTTLLKNEGNTLPVKNEKTIILCPGSMYVEYVKETVEQLKKDGVLKEADQIRVISFRGLKSVYAAWNVSEYDNVVAISSTDSVDRLDGTLEDAFLKEARKTVQKKEGRFILISSSLPYDTAVYQEADAILVTCGDYAAAGASAGREGKTEGLGPNLAAAIGAVFGSFTPSGSLPVDIPKLNDAGEMTKTILYRQGFGVQNWHNGRIRDEVRKAGASNDDGQNPSEEGKNEGGIRDGSVIHAIKAFPAQMGMLEMLLFWTLLV